MKIKYILSKDERVKGFNDLIQENFPNFITEPNPETILVGGGDGAMHHAIHDNPNFNGAFLGKGLGTLNFLMNDFGGKDITILDDLQKDKIQLNYVQTNSIDIYINNQKIGRSINDIIIGDSINDYIKYIINTNDKSFADFEVKGSGICISTTIGSTAYHFNNGGTILPLNSNLWGITGVVCNRFINDILEPQETQITANFGNIYIDGIYIYTLEKEDILTLKPGIDVKLAFLNNSDFIQKRVELANRYRR